MTTFLFKKSLGFCHAPDGSEAEVHLLTARTPRMFIPGGSSLVGEVVSPKEVRRFHEGADLPHFPEAAEAALQRLADFVESKEVGDEVPTEEVFPGYGRDIFFVAYTEEHEAVPFALEAGFRVCPGHEYKLLGSGKIGEPWKRLLESQNRG